MYKITVAIPTYERIEYLRTLARSLDACRLIDACNIRIYDDCSRTLSRRDLAALFPAAAEIVVRDRNLGADRNMHQIYRDFLATGDDLLAVIDSDLICNPSFIEFIIDNIDRTDGMLSLYNSISHETIGDVDDLFVAKAHVGSAGTVFKREIVQRIVDNKRLDPGFRYDWGWSAYLIDCGIRLFTARESLLQHIGVYGQNCNGTVTVQIGRHFRPVTQVNYDATLAAYESIIENYHQIVSSEYAAFKKSKDYRIGHALLAPLRGLRRLVRRITRRMR